jgi:hypothetical protein
MAAQELGILSLVIFVWFKMPRWFRRLHNFQQARALQNVAPTPESAEKLEDKGQSSLGSALLSQQAPVPYEQSIWAAAEEPARLLVTVGALTHL